MSQEAPDCPQCGTKCTSTVIRDFGTLTADLWICPNRECRHRWSKRLLSADYIPEPEPDVEMIESYLVGVILDELQSIAVRSAAAKILIRHLCSELEALDVATRLGHLGDREMMCVVVTELKEHYEEFDWEPQTVWVVAEMLPFRESGEPEPKDEMERFRSILNRMRGTRIRDLLDEGELKTLVLVRTQSEKEAVECVKRIAEEHHITLSIAEYGTA